MEIPLFQLQQPRNSFIESGTALWVRPHEKAAGADDVCYQTEQGQIILTFWQGALHAVIYQTPAKTASEALLRNVRIFNHYGDGQSFEEILDNGFGKTYRRSDMNRFALWSYAVDYTTVGTMAFHNVMWG